MSDNTTSINKHISSTGLCSRRMADTWIEEGRVKINGKTAQKGNRVSDNDKVTLDGKPLKSRPEFIYIAFNKPPGITSTTDLKDKDNIIDYLKYPERIFPIGRLDKDSEGLILMTSNGDIVNKILRSKNNHEKEYIVTVNKAVTKDFIKKMSAGIPVLGEVTRKCHTEQISKFVFKIILKEGLNRQIRRMCSYLNYKVQKLQRIRIMNIHLDIPAGEWRYLNNTEIREIQLLVSSSSKT
ncbi:MAG TPA: pseudouridine synthase [Chitinophagaceae bacterium]|nr:pseudouridine synthase [Chitinophagaceae bacterium]